MATTWRGFQLTPGVLRPRDGVEPWTGSRHDLTLPVAPSIPGLHPSRSYSCMAHFYFVLVSIASPWPPPPQLDLQIG